MSSLGLIIGAIGASAVWRGISPTLDGWTLLVVGGVLFSESAARKIAAVVRRFEGMPQNGSVGRQNTPAPMRTSFGKTDAAHASNASGVVSLWGGALGSETDTGINVTAWNHFSALASGDKVVVLHTGHGWLVVGAAGATIKVGKTDAAHNKGASGTISIWSGTLGSETDSGVNETAWNKFGNVASGKWVAIANNGNGYYIISAEC